MTKHTDRTHLALRAWLEEHVGEHVDLLTGEVVVTQLAEAAAYAWDREDWLDDDQHPVWDLAVDVAEVHETALAAFGGY